MNPKSDPTYQAIKDAWTEKLKDIDLAECITAGIYEAMPMAKDILQIIKEKKK